MLSTLSSIAAGACALLLYLASPNCRLVHGLAPRALRWLAAGSALVALTAAIPALGIGAGVCAVIGVWMLVAIALPYLALLRSARDTTERD